jgi:hypothetical protein
MIQVNVSVDDRLTGELESIQRQLKQVPRESLQEFRSLTPVDTGNARRNTNLNGDTIELNYPYAERLDNGWSKQAPKGMTVPFERWFQNRIRQILGR